MGVHILMDKVADHYDRNPEFAAALNRFVEDFEYPNWSHRTITDVMESMEKTQLSPWVGIKVIADAFDVEVPIKHRHYSEQFIRGLNETYGWTIFAANRVVQKAFGDEMFFAHFDDSGRYLTLDRGLSLEDVVFDVDCRDRDVASVAAVFNQKAEAIYLTKKLEKLIIVAPAVADAEMAGAAYSRIEARDMAYGDAEGALKLVEIIGAREIKPRLQSMRETGVEVLTPDMAGLWAEVDVVDYCKVAIHQKDGDEGYLVDAALCIASNMERNVAYKVAVVEFAPEVADEVMKIYSVEQGKIEAKEARKSAEHAEMRWQVVPPSHDGGMVGLMDRQDGKDMVIDFGGVPAIQNFAKENPDVPVRVINELLARDGGYVEIMDTFREKPKHIICLQRDAENRVVVRDTADAAWAAAAENVVLAHSFREAEMIAETKGMYETNFLNESYNGKVMGLTALHVVLSLGRSAVICEQAALDRVPNKDEMVSIAFTAGRGVVSPPVQEKEVDNGR